MPVQQLQVSNPCSGVVVVTPDADRPKSYLRFEAKGDPDGGDTLFVPRDTAMQTAFIKAVKRGVLVVDSDLSKDQELAVLLRTSTKPRTSAEASQPLTVQKVDFDEASGYRPSTTDIPVIIDPLAKV